MSHDNGSNITAALKQIPSGLFILTCAYDGARTGILARWAQPCSIDPPLVMVAIPEGLPVVPLIRDSRAFALCQISDGDLLLKRHFAKPPERGDDPFVTLPSHQAPSGSPIIQRALSYIDCRVVRHVDLDTDHRLYVGQVLHGEIIDSKSQPAIELGGNCVGSPIGLAPKNSRTES